MSTTLTLRIAAVATFTLLIAGTASAQMAGGLARADANKDGAISAAEATEARKAMFARLDRNADSQITPEEIEAARDRITAVSQFADAALVLRTQRLDTNGDNVLSMEEFMASNPMFEMADRNGDGIASAEELAEVRDRFAKFRR